MSTKRFRHIATALAATALTFAAAGCDDFFSKTGDDMEIAADRLFSDDGAFRSVVTDAYIQLRSPHLYGGTLTLTLLEPLAGSFDAFDAATGTADSPERAVKLDSVRLYAHRVIATCNEVVKAATDARMTNAEVRMAVGEAYALRAAVRFDLIRLADRMGIMSDGTGASVLESVESDLRRAAALLEGVDPLLSESQTTVAVGRQDRRLRTHAMNWYAVKAVQARVALWRGDYSAALAEADSVLLHHERVSQRNQVFYFVQPGKFGSDFCFSREFVFAIATRPDGFPALSDSLFLGLGVKCTRSLRSIYADPADIRYRAWFRPAADGDGYSMARKFGSETLLSGYVVSTTGGEMQLPASIPFIKLGEVVLTAAEALCRLGRVDEALERVETLEQQRDCPSYATSLRENGVISAESVGSLIADEYERELFGEGQLYYRKEPNAQHLTPNTQHPNDAVPIP